ncbi:hypothetical protein WG66_016863 [Moniliophthora roreri]|uniref:Secreted protein n=1 Tax=Moniliophthora roreri TaxID=221103 RepID=A0A0W0G867_MONRR|nr:hypothetical protein WG66_016863 [Moniliophthora roreri]
MTIPTVTTIIALPTATAVAALPETTTIITFPAAATPARALLIEGDIKPLCRMQRLDAPQPPDNMCILFAYAV